MIHRSLPKLGKSPGDVVSFSFMASRFETQFELFHAIVKMFISFVSTLAFP